MTMDEDNSVRKAAAATPNAPVEEAITALMKREERMAYIIDLLTNMPVKALRDLVQDEEASVRDVVATNSNTPVAVLRVLAKDEEASVRQRVAANSNTPVKALRDLVQDEEASVRQRVAANSNTPVKALRVLAKDEEASVRRRVAANSNTPAAVLRVLLQDGSWFVRRAVAANPNIVTDRTLILEHKFEYHLPESKDEVLRVRVHLYRLHDRVFKEIIIVVSTYFSPIFIADEVEEVPQDALEMYRDGIKTIARELRGHEMNDQVCRAGSLTTRSG